MANAVLQLVVASSSNIFAFGISSDPEGAVSTVGRANDLGAELLEVLGVVLDVGADGVLTSVVNIGLTRDFPFFLTVVLAFELLSKKEIRLFDPHKLTL